MGNPNPNKAGLLKRVHGCKVAPHKRMKLRSKTADQIEVLEKRREVIRLRTERMPYKEIAAKLNMAIGTVYNIVNEAMQAIADEVENDSKFYRALETQKLDRMEAEVDQMFYGDVQWQKKIRGETMMVDVDEAEIRLKHVDRKLKIMERRAALWGLDATNKEEAKNPHELPPAQVAVSVQVVMPLLQSVIAGKVTEGSIIPA